MSAPSWAKRPRGWARTSMRRTRRWHRRATRFAGTERGVRSLIAILAAGLSVYVLTEGWGSRVAMLAVVLLSVSAGILLIAIWPSQARRLWQAADRWTSGVLDGVIEFAEARLLQLTVIVIAVVAILTIVFWVWLITGSEIHTETQGNQQTAIRTDVTESGSTTFRNLSLVFAALLALPIAIWRTRVAQLQATTAQREHLHSLYREGADKLLSDDLSVRLDGVYILDRLARDMPDGYHIQTMSRLCAFLRNSRNVREVNGNLQEDDRAVAEAIRSRGESGRRIEEQSQFTLSLHSTNLKGVWFNRAVLSGGDFSLTHLEDAKFDSADLSEAHFYKSNLNSAIIYDAELTGTKFSLNGEHPASGLTQDQIDEAWCDQDKLPMLDGVMDAVTGRQLTPPKRRMSLAAEIAKMRSEIGQIADRK